MLLLKYYSSNVEHIKEFVIFQALTKDSVTVTVDAVVYYRIQDPLNAVVKVTNYR